MNSETGPPAWEKYREAQFFCRKLERADDGLGHVRSRTDTDEFRFYCSGFCSAVDDLHRQVTAADDRPSFEAWVDEDATRALHAFFEDRCHDVLDVTTIRQGSPGDEAPIGTTTREPVGADTARYCLADGDDVPAELVPDDAEGAPTSDLARAYLGHLDAWLSDTDPEREGERAEA